METTITTEFTFKGAHTQCEINRGLDIKHIFGRFIVVNSLKSKQLA